MAIYFDPWVGDDYWNDGGIFNKKILIIGNNHYCCRDDCGCCGVSGCDLDDWECSSMTQDVIQKYIDWQNDNEDYENWMDTFSNFENSIDDCSASEDVWNSVAFYNYLQSAVNDDDEKSSSKKIYRRYYSDYCESEDSLWEVIENLEPDYIIIWGSIVRDHIGYEINDKTGIPTLMIHHPSQGYDISYWKNEIDDFLN